jgi:hypothetical protein
MSKIRLYGATSGYLELKAPAVSPDAEVEIPAAFGPYGKVLQVVQTVKTDTFSTSSTTFTDVTGLSVSITPSLNTSKVLVIAQVNYSGTFTSNSSSHLQLVRGSTEIYRGDAASNRIRSMASMRPNEATSGISGYSIWSAMAVYLDSPATTSSTTYKIQARRGSAGSVQINSSGEDGNNAENGRTASSVTVMEIGA